jgi:CRP-like cAMP-binding protein
MRTIGYEKLAAMRSQNSQVRAFLDREVVESERRTIENSTRLALLSPVQCVALLLADLAERFGNSGISDIVDETRQMIGTREQGETHEWSLYIGLLQGEIGQMVGYTREHVCRVLRDLKDLRMVRDGPMKGSFVINMDKIRKMKA